MPRADYEAGIEADNARAAKHSRDSRDILKDFPSADAVNRVLRSSCERDFKRFCEAYFPHAFDMAWSEEHLKVIGQMQEAVLEGGLFAVAMPRGSGKSALSLRAVIWALLYGHRRFVCLVCATADLAKKKLDEIKTELTCNEALIRDFRAVCYPLKRLENNARKAIGQLYDGEQTRIDWSDDQLTLPTMPDSACDGKNVSGSTVTVAGLTGALRGQSHTLPTGEVLRPQLVILDDPQTRDSANSPKQSADRAAIIRGDVLGMAGPGKEIAAIMPCTVIRDGDMASEMLDREKCPEWHGRRTKMVISWPVETGLWEEYARLRAEGMKADRGTAEATAFYLAHRAAMDRGAEVAWPARKYPREVSAVQHAMNLLYDVKPAAFHAEYQNDPLPLEDLGAAILSADEIASRLSRHRRGVLPVSATRLTAFVDVHEHIHYYSVVAWEEDFTGYVVDYGTFPDQKRAYFSHKDLKIRLADAVKAAGPEGRVYAGLERVAEAILDREYRREDGLTFRVDRCLVDANNGSHTNIVYKFCRQSVHAAVLYPSHGKGIGASGKPMNDLPKKPGDKVGLNWRIPVDRGRRAIRKVLFDANYWKTFVHNRFAVAIGDRGALTLFGDDPSRHRMYADHLTAERPVAVQRKDSSRTVDEWRLIVDRDNHYLDTLCGAALAASIQGVQLPEVMARPAAQGKPARVSFAAMQRERRA